MPPLIQLSFDGSDARMVQILRARGPQMIAALLPTMDALDIRLTSYIKGDLLHGQVLHQRSGKLVGSIRAIPAHAEGTFLVGAVEGGGGPAPYGEVHEYGLTVTMRRSIKNPSHMVTRKDGSKAMTGSPYKVHFPERSFMRRGAADKRSEIEERLRQRLSELTEL